MPLHCNSFTRNELKWSGRMPLEMCTQKFKTQQQFALRKWVWSAENADAAKGIPEKVQANGTITAPSPQPSGTTQRVGSNANKLPSRARVRTRTDFDMLLSPTHTRVACVRIDVHPARVDACHLIRNRNISNFFVKMRFVSSAVAPAYTGLFHTRNNGLNGR